jgi:DNA-binding NtrC family response regulator
MKTAELLGISRKTLWEKMKRLKVASDTVNDTGSG